VAQRPCGAQKHFNREVDGEAKETALSSRLIKVACIPAFNEEKTIGKVVDRAQPYVDQVLVPPQLGQSLVHRPRNLALPPVFCGSLNASGATG